MKKMMRENKHGLRTPVSLALNVYSNAMRRALSMVIFNKYPCINKPLALRQKDKHKEPSVRWASLVESTSAKNGITTD